MNNRHLYILAAVLAIVGAGIFSYKAVWLELPLKPEGKVENWEVQAKVTFDARSGPAKLVLFIPRNEPPFTIVDQSFVSEGYGLTTASRGDNRRALFSIREAVGTQTLYYRFIVNRSIFSGPAKAVEEPEIVKPTLDEMRLAAAQGILNKILPESADDDTLVRLLLKRLTASVPDDNVAMLLGGSSTMLRRVRIARQILALAGLRARTVSGVQLVKANKNAQLTHWLEVYIGDAWQGYAPQTETYTVPANFLPWWRGPGPLAFVEGGMFLKTSLSIAAASAPALRTALIVGKANERSLLDYSMFTLPLNTQLVYKIILTVPLGVLFLTILRNVIGLRTMGTFMPILIAIAFRETQVLWGVVLFSVVISVGLLVRLYLENLRLLVVPRLSCVLIVVVLTMAAISVASNQLGLQRGLSVSLFPMVILTMTVERMSIIWDERGAGEMLRQGIGSMIIAVIAYFIMVNQYAEHIALIFPELLLILLSGNLLIGRYSGFRLLDLPRFRVLAGRAS
jgi:hypothetical protein